MQHVIYSIGRIREVLKHLEQRKHTVISRKEGKHALAQYNIAKQNRTREEVKKARADRKAKSNTNTE
jgi:DNA-directed RNA polymerase subunit H (RpoH/RPB5)